MSTSWLVYTMVVPALVAVAALSGERLLRLYGRPARVAWALGLVVSLLSAPAALLWGRASAPAVPGDAIAASAPALVPMGAVVEFERSWRDALPRVPESVERAAGTGAIVAAVVMLLLLGTTLLRLRLERRRWTRERVEEESVLVSGALGPAVVGVVRPAIVLPRWLLAESAAVRRLALAHEREHVRAWDTRLLLFGCVAAAAMPWSPAVWWQLRRLRLAIELDCDRRVLRAGAAPDEYGAMLLGVAARRTRTPAPALALLHPRRMIERRILAMTDNLPSHRILRAGGFAAAGVFVLAVACDVPAPTEPLPRSDTEAAVATIAPTRATLTEVRPGSEPLFIVDGVIVSGDRGWITNLNEDIESIEIVKGDAAASLYGDRARNGVIMITTRGGDGARAERAAYIAAREVELTEREREAMVAEAVRARKPLLRGEVQEAVVAERAARQARIEMEAAAAPLKRALTAEEAVVLEAARKEITDSVLKLKNELVARAELRAAEAGSAAARREAEVAVTEERAAAYKEAEVAVTEELRVLLSERAARQNVRVLPRQSSVRGGQPLYIVDGVIIDADRLEIDALDIESIEIVKGAAAAQLYGSRAGNGVIMITTKKR